ncbi:hypothetical protein SBBP1_310003 [Burkholderiales bacterium]|nr:hypothetical protein SBBP1_310003 [Burkholderiales bacterium]
MALASGPGCRLPGGASRRLVAVARLPAQPDSHAARPDVRPARQGVSHAAIDDRNRIGRGLRQGLDAGHADALGVHSGAHHRLHLRRVLGGVRPGWQPRFDRAVLRPGGPRADDCRKRRHALLAAARGVDRDDPVHLRLREHGDGERGPAGGGRSAAPDQLRRHRAGHHRHGLRHADDDPAPSQAGAKLTLRVAALLAVLLLGACATRSAHYYADDGPPAHVPADLAATPDAVPRSEPLNPYANRPYAALGRTYVPDTSDAPFEQRGIASWYGRQFQGNRTASGEPYDMFAMSAAHPTLPIPSYARVTNVRDGRSIVVRINDRGPFLHERIIDLSFAAATRLGIAGPGSGEVVVEKITTRDMAAAARRTRLGWRHRGNDPRGCSRYRRLVGTGCAAGADPHPARRARRGGTEQLVGPARRLRRDGKRRGAARSPCAALVGAGSRRLAGGRAHAMGGIRRQVQPRADRQPRRPRHGAGLGPAARALLGPRDSAVRTLSATVHALTGAARSAW